MSFSRQPASNRRQVYLSLAGVIESKLRDAYAKRHRRGLDTQTTIANKLGVNRSAVNRRLIGRANMTIETIADMVWALGQCIDVDIFDPYERPSNAHRIISEHARPRDVTTDSATSVTDAKVEVEYAPQS
jgi:hypothetical protein